MNTVYAPVTLIVEDNVDDLFVTQRILRKVNWPFPVQAVGSGFDAMQYLAGTGEFSDRSKYPPPRLVLMDMNLPGCDGVELQQWMIDNEQVGPLLVVMLTGSLPRRGLAPTAIHPSNITIMVGAFLKPLTVESANAIRSMFDHWMSRHPVARTADVGR